MTGVAVPVWNTAIVSLPGESELYPDCGSTTPKPTSVNALFPPSEMSRLLGASAIVCTTRNRATEFPEPQLAEEVAIATIANAKKRALNRRGMYFPRRAVLFGAID